MRSPSVRRVSRTISAFQSHVVVQSGIATSIGDMNASPMTYACWPCEVIETAVWPGVCPGVGSVTSAEVSASSPSISSSCGLPAIPAMFFTKLGRWGSSALKKSQSAFGTR